MNRQFWIVVGSMGAGLLLFAWLGWQFLLNPVAKDIADQTVALQGLQDNLEKVKGAQAQYEKFKRDAEATRHDVQLLRQRLDPVLSQGELVRIINGQAQSLNPTGLTWTYSPRKVSKIEGQTGLDEVPFELKFTSDYETVGKILNGMVSQLRMISPEKVTLTSFDDTTDGRNTLTAVIDFKVYLETMPK